MLPWFFSALVSFAMHLLTRLRVPPVCAHKFSLVPTNRWNTTASIQQNSPYSTGCSQEGCVVAMPRLLCVFPPLCFSGLARPHQAVVVPSCSQLFFVFAYPNRLVLTRQPSSLRLTFSSLVNPRTVNETPQSFFSLCSKCVLCRILCNAPCLSALELVCLERR